jgi:ribosomal-protein-alanine N-acetyltransferase
MWTIETPRLRLVPVRPENSETLWRMLQQPNLRAHQDLPDVDREQFRRIVEARPKELRPGELGRFEWLVYESGTRAASGWVSLRMQDRDARAAEVGYSLLSERRGLGIASEAVRALIREGFERANLLRIRAYCVPDNGPSRGVLRNAGFTQDDVLPNGATVNGRPVDVLVYAVDRATIIPSES